MKMTPVLAVPSLIHGEDEIVVYARSSARIRRKPHQKGAVLKHALEGAKQKKGDTRV